MRSGGIVISDIPVHREVYGSASEYFDPYSAEDAALVIGSTIGSRAVVARARLMVEGIQVSDRYTPRHILPKWDEFFQGLK